MAEVLAVIPARGGSKGIPRKNIRLFAGQPLIAYSIQHAHASRYVTRTVVTTDDTEIADVARRYGAEVPFMRPPELAGDMAMDLEVFEHLLFELKSSHAYEPDLIVHLRPTSPLRRVELIDLAIEMMLGRPDADSLKTLSVSKLTPYKMWRIDQGLIQPLLEVPGLPEAHSMPRQVLPTVYTGNGYLDIIRPRTVLSLKSMVGRTVLPLIVEEATHDLDYPEQIPALEAALMQQRTMPHTPRSTPQTNHFDQTGTGKA
jgi:N-acylneuraminate cytidylyltransferase